MILAAADGAGVGVALVALDPPPRTLFVNEALARWVREPAEAVVLRPVFELVAPEDRERVTEAFRRRAMDRGMPRSVECTLVASDGERIPVGLGVVRGEHESQPVQIVVITDLRDRKAAAAKLSESERRFRALLEAAPDGVVISQQLTIRYANRAAEAILGVPSLVGHSLAEFLAREELERMRTRLATKASGEALAPAIYRAVRPDGRVVLAEIASITTEHEGQPAVLAIARDVTDREALQANLERTERLAALGRLAAGMAHEINNPLAFVSLSAEALERRIGALPLDPARRAELAGLIEHITRGTARVAAIVRDLKAFSRDGDTERGPADVELALANATRMVQHELSARARLVRDVPALPSVACSPRKLEQVFVNLLLNALQSFPESHAGTVTLRASSDEACVSVTIADDGAGIPRAHLDRVFDPFFTTKPVGVGTGLGLSICHGIVTAAGGTIEIESAEGRGTAVHVRVPRATAPSLPAATRAPSREITRPGPRARILVVEDQVALARTLAKGLEARFEVTIALGVAEAVAALDRHGSTLDAVVCDMLMPDGTGIDVHRVAAARTPALADRFVFMTGGAFLPSLAEFLERMPPTRRIEKPFQLQAMEELIEAIVSARKG